MMFAVCKKAQQIKNTLTRSFDHQKEMNIRFFDYVDEVVSPQSQLPSKLPVGIINAVERMSIPKGTNPSDVLALLPMVESTVSIVPDRSTTNHTSLVLHAPATEEYPAVLFSADSDFTFAQRGLPFPWSPGMLITAPHHGSQANSGLAQLYQRAHAAHRVPSSLWVRSDTKQECNGLRPGTWWRVNLGPSVGVKKYCTSCRSNTPTHQNIQFKINLQAQWKTDSAHCTC